MADICHVGLDTLVLGSAVWLVGVALHLTRQAGKTYHLDIVAIAVWPLVLAGLWSELLGLSVALLLATLAAGAVRVLLVKPVLDLVMRRHRDPSTLLVASFCLMQTSIMLANAWISPIAMPPLVRERYTSSSHIVSNVHIAAVVLVVLLLLVGFLVGRILPFGPVAHALADHPHQLTVLGFNLTRWRLVVHCVAVVLALAGGLLFSFVNQSIENRDTWLLLVMSLPAALWSSQRALLVSAATSLLIAACYSALPLWLSARYVYLSMGMAILFASSAFLVASRVEQRRGGHSASA